MCDGVSPWRCLHKGSRQVGVVLTSRSEVQRALRRGYRSFDRGRSVGFGTVVLRLEVAEDGHVSLARVNKAKPGGHHPALNTIARRAASRMVFEPIQDGRTERNRTLLQQIAFRR